MLYWTPISGDALPADLAGPTFDAAVNSGPHRAVTWLQAALGVQADGLVGPATVARARTVNDVASVREAMLAERVIFLTGLKTFATFGTGWTRRVIGLAATHFI
jgi:lysozyme family protein